MCTISSQLLVFISSRFSLPSPMPVKCPWPSMKPGIANWPLSSMTCVDGPMKRAIVGVRPDGDDRPVPRRDRLRLRDPLRRA